MEVFSNCHAIVAELLPMPYLSDRIEEQKKVKGTVFLVCFVHLMLVIVMEVVNKV